MSLSSKTLQYLKYGFALLVFVGILWIGFFGDVFAEHTEQFKAQGYAYGSIDMDQDNNTETGIGYLSFGCESDTGSACEATATDNFPTGYGVRINTDVNSEDYGKFFGYAWSSNYGWVSFYHNDAAVCGGGIALQDTTTFIHTPGQTQILKGNARVLNYDDSEWNGCISFSDGDSYGVKAESLASNDLKLSGWAWGSQLIGWVSFDCDYCNVTFSPIEAECDEADNPEECAPEGPESGLALYVGNDQAPTEQIIGNSTYTLPITDPDLSGNVKLVPQAFGQDVGSCTATATGNQGASIAGWSGPLGALDPLSPGDVSNTFIATISNYEVGEIVTFTIECIGLEDNSPVSAQAFVTLLFPEPTVSIWANPNPIDPILDPSGSTTLSWTFDNVQEDTCEITGVVDFTPEINDPLSPIDAAFAADIGFNSWSPNNPGSDDLFGIINFPIGFNLTCLGYDDQPVSDTVYITINGIGCTESMEAAGWCSNDINPIFEEF